MMILSPSCPLCPMELMTIPLALSTFELVLGVLVQLVLLAGFLFFIIGTCVYQLRHPEEGPDPAKKRINRIGYKFCIGMAIVGALIILPDIFTENQEDKEYEQMMQRIREQQQRATPLHMQLGRLSPSVPSKPYPDLERTLTPSQQMEYFDRHYEDYLDDPEDELRFPPAIFDDNMEWDPADRDTWPPDVTVEDF